MKKLIVFFCIFTLYCQAFKSKREISTFISPHSPSVNAARELAGWENLVNIYTSDSTYGAFAITPEATLSFRPERIAQCLFGEDIIECVRTFTVSGSRRSREQTDWLADYFGLPTDYLSAVDVRPKISNALVDLNIFIGWDKYIPGLYFRMHAPLTYTRWDLNPCETLITTGSDAHDPGYFNPEGIPRIQLVDNFTNFITGEDAPKATNLIFNKLKYAKMNCKGNRALKLSEIQVAFGYNVLHTEDYHLGGNIRFSIPTGNRPKGEYLFEPIIGNGHHWELGGGLSTHIVIWDNEETEEKAALYCDINITHMFSTQQKRSFDLCVGANSRYMLAQKMGTPIIDNLRGLVNGERIEPKFQYQQEVTSVANLTTLDVEVSNSVQADIAVMLAYTKGKNSWTFGYSFWGRSTDCITLCDTTPFDLETWAIKGDSQVFGFEDTASQTAVALSATQSKATVNAGTNFPATGATTATEIADGMANSNIDNPKLAVSDSDDNGVFVNLVTQAGGSTQINTSIQPKILTTADINIDSAKTRGLSNKIFSSFTHLVTHRELWPYIGFGAEIEFGQSSEGCKYEARVVEKACVNTALSFWGVWLKTGVAF